MSDSGHRPTVPNRPKPAEYQGTLVQDNAFDDTRRLSDLQPPLTKTAPPSGPLPEQLGHYRIVKPLGRGGMGAVYLAEDTQLRRQAAVKLMLPDVALVAQARERFLREARAAAAVRNDHVVTVYQVGEQEGVPFIAMELLQGVTLDGYLAKETPGIAAIVRLGREIAEGLAAAHARGLVHRDIKPANIWLEAPNGRVKLLDFGLARPTKPDPDAASVVTHDGMVIGTPAYMSPEQARGEAVDFRTDLFSLGIVLYRLCAGELPFSGPTVTAILTNLAIAYPRPAHEVNPKVPLALSNLIDRLLEKEPADRPASARDVADELRAIERNPGKRTAVTVPLKPPGIEVVEDEPTEVESPEPRTARRRRKRRQPVPTALFAGMGAAAVLLVAGGMFLALMPRKPATPTTADTRPAERKSAEPKATEARPAPTAPAETRPIESRPIELRPPPPPDRGPPPPDRGPPPGGGPPPRGPRP